MKRYPFSAIRFAPLSGAFRESNAVRAVFQINSVLMWIRGIAEHFSGSCLLFSIGKKWYPGRASLPQIHVQLQSSPDTSWSVVGQCLAVMLLHQQVAIPPYQDSDRDSDRNVVTNRHGPAGLNFFCCLRVVSKSLAISPVHFRKQ